MYGCYFFSTMAICHNNCAVFTYHGAVYITLKTEGIVLKRGQEAAEKVGIVAIVLWVLLLVLSVVTFSGMKPAVIVTLVLATGSVLASYAFVKKEKSGKAFIFNGVAIVFVVASIFLGLFPNVMVSNINEAFNLTVTNASSSPYTLKVMTIVALTMVPIVLAYQVWSYWVFRKRVTEDKLEY